MPAAPPKVLAPKPDLAARTFAANTPPPHAAFQVPYAPPPEPLPRARRRRLRTRPFQIPFAPPPEDDGERARGLGREEVQQRRHARPGAGARGVRPRRTAGDRRARQALRSAQHPRRAEVRRAPRRGRRARVVRVPVLGDPPLPRREGRGDRRLERTQARGSRRAQDGRGGRRRRFVALRVGPEGGRVDGAREPAGRAVRLGRELLHRHPPRRSLEGGHREAVSGRAVLQVRAPPGGRVRRQGRHLPRLLLGGQGRGARQARQVLRRPRPGDLQDHAEDAAALRAHQLEVRPQALPPDPARREGAPRHRLRGAARHAGLGVGQRARRSRSASSAARATPSSSPTPTASRPATTTCRATRAGCTSGSR